MELAVLGLGGNIGSRRALLACACDLLASQPGLVIEALSPLYHTPPLGPPQPDYVNAALKVSWPGSARSLLIVTQHVEQLLQRQRALRWGPRTLDIDLLYWSAGAIAEPGLTIPHPALAERLFALVPLLDVAPELAARFPLPSARRAFAPSEPFAPRALLAQGKAVTAPSEDPLELLAALPRALSLFAPNPAGARAVLPFALACSGEALSLSGLAQPMATLHARVVSAFNSGFQVRSAAITEVSAGRVSGVFVGLHDAGCAPLPSLVPTLSSGSGPATITVQPT